MSDMQVGQHDPQNTRLNYHCYRCSWPLRQLVPGSLVRRDTRGVLQQWLAHFLCCECGRS